MKFVEESFITNERLSLAIVDKRITIDMENKLKNYDINIIKTPSCDDTYNAIKHHPDISVCKLDVNNIVVAPNVYDYYNDILSNYNFNVIKGNYTDNIILEYLDKFNIKKINVKQGYCKCSICIVDENSIITSDEGIHKEVIKYGIDSLLIEKGYIDLFDLDYGFIGGCSGLISKDTLSFFGDIKKHPDYNRILEFVNKKNKKIISLSNEKLLDLGSLIPLCTI